jgi:hypothetical protein
MARMPQAAATPKEASKLCRFWAIIRPRPVILDEEADAASPDEYSADVEAP